MTKRPKAEVLPPATRHTPPLNTVGNVLRDQARTYRQVLNNRIPSDEGTRRIYRTTIEAAQAAVDITPLAAPAVTVHILPIAAGSFLSPEDVARARRGEPLALEFAPAEPPPGRATHRVSRRRSMTGRSLPFADLLSRPSPSHHLLPDRSVA